MTGAPRARRPSRQPPQRDTDATPFAAILGRLLGRVPGAYGAALVDLEGETVDYAGLVGSFDLRVAAAEVRLALDQISRAMPRGEGLWMVLRGARKSLVARELPEGYALVLLLRRRAGFTASRRAFAACERELAEEAGWRAPSFRERSDGRGRAPRADQAVAKLDAPWWPIEVEVDGRGRPRQVRTPRGQTLGVEVLGAIVGLASGERGFRVRTQDGEEVTLVREARRCWYVDAPLAEARQTSARP